MAISLLFPTDTWVKTNILSESTQHDLGLDIICKHIAKNADEEKYILNVMSQMTDSPEIAAYRIEIFDDIFHCPKMCDDLMDTLKKIRLIKEYGRLKKIQSDVPGMWDLLHRLEELRDYIAAIEALHSCLADEGVTSRGLMALRDYIEVLYHEHGFKELKEDILRLKVSLNDIKSVTLGINLNERFESAGVGVISINNQFFTKSTIINSFSDFLSGGDKIKDGIDWNGAYKYYPVTIASIPEGDTGSDITKNLDSATDYLLNSTVKKLKNVLSKYVSVTIDDVIKLIPEFTYYIRWSEYISKLMESGYSFCKAEVISDSGMRAEEIYNLKLTCLDIASESIVTNDLEFSDQKCVYILTGANRGGKTTFTQAIGLLYVLAGGGIYVPGKKFCFSPVDCIFTHFPVDEEKTLNLGRLGEECKRFRNLFLQATSSSLLLLNESFATTSFEEGYYIAKDSVKAILNKRAKTIFNTHMHKLAFDVEEMNATSNEAKAVSMVVRTQGHERSYKVEIAPPEGMSLARDIAVKYGVTYEMLLEK